MTLKIETRFAFATDQPTDVLLQFAAAADAPGQAVRAADTRLSQPLPVRSLPGESGIGERLLLPVTGPLEVVYHAEVAVSRTEPALALLEPVAAHDLPPEAVPYLLESRYCLAEQVTGLVEAEFGGLCGGARIAAMAAWIAARLSYVPGSSTTETTSADTLGSGQGVCRDYAHVLIALARASQIPARYVACYAPRVAPQDFHAVAEVYLAGPGAVGGGWHMVDATGMAEPALTAIIGVGRDAADVSFLTSFGPSCFLSSGVAVRAV